MGYGEYKNDGGMSPVPVSGVANKYRIQPSIVSVLPTLRHTSYCELSS